MAPLINDAITALGRGEPSGRWLRLSRTIPRIANVIAASINGPDET
ncbi:MAG: hypothetical protein WDO18_13485 [Acidobacteriota bacterium]